VLQWKERTLKPQGKARKEIWGPGQEQKQKKGENKENKGKDRKETTQSFGLDSKSPRASCICM